jgi:ribonuclease HI
MSKVWTVVIQKLFYNILNLNTRLQIPKMPFYAVARGRTTGIFMTWPDCEAQVKGFPGARYKKFDTVVGAQDFVTSNSGGNTGSSKPSYKNKTSKFPQTQHNNLKRAYSTVPSDGNGQYSGFKSNTSETKTNITQEQSDSDSDQFPDDDDLNDMLTKQLDDVEKRLKGFEKNIDKIYKKGAKNTNRRTILIEPPQNKKSKTGGIEFSEDHEGFVQVYTDGACSSNGRNNAKAGLGVYWCDGHPLNISEPVSGRATNNCGEIQAATRAIKVALQNGVSKLSINTDSKFLINSVTKWMPGEIK